MQKRRLRSTAGLLPRAVEEIKRLKAEWANLKECDLLEISYISSRDTNGRESPQKGLSKNSRAASRGSEALRGVVAVVEVGSESRALPLRAALCALGATVAPVWNPFVTHLVWSEGGDRSARAHARASAARVVSPLWVEACAAATRRLPERTFPAAARESDVPSPATLLKLLKRAEKDNVPLASLLSNEMDRKSVRTHKPVSTITSRDVVASDSEDDGHDTTRDRSEGTSRNTTASTSRDRSSDTSGNQSKHRCSMTYAESSSPVPVKSNLKKARPLSMILEETMYITEVGCGKLYPSHVSNDEETRVNKRPRRALPMSVSSPGEGLPYGFRPRSPRSPVAVTASSNGRAFSHRDLTAISRAERTARKHAAPTDPRLDRHREQPGASRRAPASGPPARPLSQETVHTRDGKLRIVVTGMSRSERRGVFEAIKQMPGKVQKEVNYKTTHVVVGSFGQGPGDYYPRGNDESNVGCWRELRTLSALAGAARGCRLVRAQWVFDSVRARRWLSHRPYPVPHLNTIAEKAYLERRAFDMMDSEFAFNVFRGQRVRLSSGAGNRPAAQHLLALCGAVVLDERGRILHNEHLAGPTQNGDRFGPSGEPEVVIGPRPGQVSSKWVFDSVGRGRMHSVRKYLATGLG